MGNPFVHVELNAADLGKAKKFYKKIFDWKLTDMPGMGGYTMVDVGGGVGGGMQNPPPGTPPGWFAYVGVANVKKTLAKAKKAGATILMDYHPVGTMGALGVFADPNGAPLGIWEAAPPAKKGAKKAAKRAAKKAAEEPAKKKKKKKKK